MRTPNKRQKNYDKTLKWVNKKREEFGDPELDEILTGVRGSTLHCPLAHSIGHKVQVGPYFISRLHPEGYHYMLRLPRYARQFVKDFDCGLYPELSARFDYNKSMVVNMTEGEQVVERV